MKNGKGILKRFAAVALAVAMVAGNGANVCAYGQDYHHQDQSKDKDKGKDKDSESYSGAAGYYVLCDGEKRPEDLTKSDSSSKYIYVGAGSISAVTGTASTNIDGHITPPTSLNIPGYNEKLSTIEWFRIIKEDDGWHVDGEIVPKETVTVKLYVYVADGDHPDGMKSDAAKNYEYAGTAKLVADAPYFNEKSTNDTVESYMVSSNFEGKYAGYEESDFDWYRIIKESDGIHIDGVLVKTPAANDGEDADKDEDYDKEPNGGDSNTDDADDDEDDNDGDADDEDDNDGDADDEDDNDGDADDEDDNDGDADDEDDNDGDADDEGDNQNPAGNQNPTGTQTPAGNQNPTGTQTPANDAVTVAEDTVAAVVANTTAPAANTTVPAVNVANDNDDEVVIDDEPVALVANDEEAEDEETAEEAADEVVIDDEETPLAAAEDGCIIHWIILILTLIAGVYNVVRVFARKNENESEEQKAEA